MGTLAQEFFFVTADVHDFARKCSAGIIGHFGHDTIPAVVRDAGRAAVVAGDTASDVKRAILEAATRAGCVKSDAEIQATYDQAEQDMYRRGKRRGGRQISVDFDSDLTPDPKTVGVTVLDTLCEETATVDNAAVKRSVAAVRAALAKVNVKAAECFDAIGAVEWDAARVQPNLVQLARALGVTRNPARKRWQTLDRILRSGDFAAMVA